MTTGRWDRIAAACRASAVDGGTVLVEETQDDGRAEVRFVAPPGWRLEKIAVDHRHGFEWLVERKSADGIVLARTPQGQWQAHIVECKKTIKEKSWAGVRAQLHGSRLRLDAIAGVLGIEIERVVLYTAFREDRIGLGSPDPILDAVPIGGREPGEPARARAAWRASTVFIPGEGPLSHRRLQLHTVEDVGRIDVEPSPSVELE